MWANIYITAHSSQSSHGAGKLLRFLIVMFFFVVLRIFGQRLLLFLHTLKIEPSEFTIRALVPLLNFTENSLYKTTTMKVFPTAYFTINILWKQLQNKERKTIIKFYPCLTLTHPTLLTFVLLPRFHPNKSMAIVYVHVYK